MVAELGNIPQLPSSDVLGVVKFTGLTSADSHVPNMEVIKNRRYFRMN